MKMVNAKKIKIKHIAISELLKNAGYRELSNGSYIYDFKEFYDNEWNYYRYHVYIVAPEIIEIHTDIKKRNGKRSYHKASMFSVSSETTRIKSFMPYVIPKRGNKEHYGLKREDRLKALAELGNPIIKHLNWKERIVWNVKQWFKQLSTGKDL